MCLMRLLSWAVSRLIPPIEISQEELDNLIKSVSEVS